MADDVADPVGAALARIVAGHPGARVLDIGGGSGTRAVPLAQAGCTVLVVDSSTDALASLARRAAEAQVADRVSALQADADQVDALLDPASFDLVLHHHVVQDVDDPAGSLAAAAAVLRPGGTLSILVPGRLSAVLAETLAGRFAAASALLDAGPDQDRRYDEPSLRALLEQAGLAVQSVTGVGLVRALAGRVADGPALADLEQALGRHPVLGQLGGDLHGLGIVPATS
jgi:ubiquinone/menaquinone biosynthesis C-methylase UbiE